MRRLDRLLSLALLLSTRRRAVAREISRELGISLRTVYRDVRALVDAGFPIEGTAGDGYRVSGAAFVRPLLLTGEEAEALTLAAHGYGVSAGGALRDSLVRATAKLEAAMSTDVARRVRALSHRVVVAQSARTIGPSSEVLEAIRDKRAARISFAPPRGASSTRTIEPLGLVCRGDAWWVVAYCQMRRDARAFRLDHVHAWTMLGAFVPRDGFSFEEVVARDAHLSERLFGYGDERDHKGTGRRRK